MINFICFIRDGKYTYYTENHNRFESDVKLDNRTLEHFDDLGMIEGIDY
ncbi:MAG: hypothetical protein HOD60_05625 [Candidatus Nitrosopelagicus sp.]|jgi:hypothetical protein|nr:hypothetical protein [Candidatus Nitrosopelagicus sp.]